MDSFELNKIIAAVLLVALLLIGIGKLSDAIFYVEKPEKPGYLVEVEQASSTTTVSAVEEEKIDIAALMALGDVNSGEKIFKKCAACHSINKGGAHKIGPALYNVVGRKIGGEAEYKYSKALVKYENALHEFNERIGSNERNHPISEDQARSAHPHPSPAASGSLSSRPRPSSSPPGFRVLPQSQPWPEASSPPATSWMRSWSRRRTARNPGAPIPSISGRWPPEPVDAPPSHPHSPSES